MHEPIKIDRILPPHELNARRARKRLTKLPKIAHTAKPKHAPKSDKGDRNGIKP